MISDDWACGCVHSGASGLLSHFSDFDDPEIREILRQHDLGDITLWREILRIHPVKATGWSFF